MVNLGGATAPGQFDVDLLARTSWMLAAGRRAQEACASFGRQVVQDISR